MIVRSQGLAFVVVQTIAIRGHAGHENIAFKIVAEGERGAFHVGCRGALLPIVDVVENGFEAARADSAPDRHGIVPVRDQVLDSFGKWVLASAVENGHRMASLQQLLDEQTADEQGSSDHQYFHRSARCNQS